MQQGGSQFGVSPDMPPFTGPGGLPEAASPISSRPPGVPTAARGSFDELGPVMGSYGEEDALGGEEAERGVSGNRWPRQETLALLKIRSEMDAAFRDATLKGPLWEDVSRKKPKWKLAELGYSRSAKKCKEKFENVHKYYKRTKEGRAGRQDGKNYRFFSQLEALHNSSTATSVTPISSAPPAVGPPPAVAVPNQPLPTPIPAGVGVSNSMVGSSSRVQPPPPPASSNPLAATPPQINVPRIGSDLASGPGAGGTASTAAISFSSNTSSSGSDSEEETEEGPTTDTRKRKRSGSGGSSRKMMAFFEGLMKEVMERQEAMQQRFLDAIEKREQDRMAREEAWKRQEMARLSREHEIMMQERAMAASRDAAVIAFLQKMTGQTIQIAQPVLIPTMAPQHVPAPQPIPQPQPPPPPQQQHPPQQQSHHHQQQPSQTQPQPPHQQSQSTESARQHQPPSSEIIIAQPEQQQEMVSLETASSSRWPKSEVLALIKLRSGLETRYQEAGPKGPLWEEISSGMQRLGFNRSSKRCKEKWENINKYFKKVKESNKKRPEDAKTCPYFHQLDALYRNKVLGSHPKHEHQEQRTEILAIMPPPPQPQPPPQPETEVKNGNITSKSSGDADAAAAQVPTSNGGGLPPSFYEEGPMKKPEDIVKELMEQQQQSVMDDYDKMDEPDSDNLDQEDDDDDEDDDDEDDEEDSKVDYKIEFQRQNVSNSNGGGNAAASNSFMAMVQKLSSS